ncbi:hypothetical protein KXW28_000196 [Aspergillus fumigatus]|nr:hypothetical protein KXW28_000196 [Aspergillus fumigatus]
MPLLDPNTQTLAESSAAQPQRLPFPPVTYSHILHCSYHQWQPRYRTLTPKSRAIPLTPSFVSYLRANGIVLPPETTRPHGDDDIDTFSDDGADEESDPSVEWQEIHSQIKSTISEFGGKVTPKLNWSAPKDAVWIIHLTVVSEAPATQPDIPYYLVLRKYVNFNPSLEFRCFVRNRVLLCMCQRDQNHFDFLFSLRDTLRSRIQAFFDEKLKDTFPDPNFVFDVYIPEPHQRVWLIDINPWADRTDPLLFSWLEILQMKDPIGIKEEDTDAPEESFVRLSLNGATPTVVEVNRDEDSESEKDVGSADDGDDSPFLPEFRLVKRDDPEAYSFSTPQYSAHKLPKEVVDASLAGSGGMSEFLGKWQDILAKQTQEDTDSDDGR